MSILNFDWWNYQRPKFCENSQGNYTVKNMVIYFKLNKLINKDKFEN